MLVFGVILVRVLPHSDQKISKYELFSRSICDYYCLNTIVNIIISVLWIIRKYCSEGSVTRKRHEIHAGMKKIYVTRMFHFGVKLMLAWNTICSQLTVLISCLSGVLASVLEILQLNGVLLMKLLQQQKHLQQLYHEALISRNLALSRYQRIRKR